LSNDGFFIFLQGDPPVFGSATAVITEVRQGAKPENSGN